MGDMSELIKAHEATIAQAKIALLKAKEQAAAAIAAAHPQLGAVYIVQGEREYKNEIHILDGCYTITDRNALRVVIYDIEIDTSGHLVMPQGKDGAYQYHTFSAQEVRNLVAEVSEADAWIAFAQSIGFDF